MTRITGWHVLACFVSGFAIIIGVNMTLAFNAIRTFPGIEVKNSYVASQSFDRDRAAQTALGWNVSATLNGNDLVLRFERNGEAIEPILERATFGRATSVAADQEPNFHFNGSTFIAPVEAGPGNWNLRLTARAEDGTVFRQRVVVDVAK